jgi:hypothetical protein
MKVVKIIILIGAIINIAVWLDINIFLASVFLIIAITTLILLLKEYDTSDIEEKINDEIEKEKRLYNNIKENNDKLKTENKETKNNSNILMGIIIILLLIIIALVIYFNSADYELKKQENKLNKVFNEIVNNMR